MTDDEALAQGIKYPNLGAAHFAYLDGRDSGDFGEKCHFTSPALIEAWKRGFRSIRADVELDNCTEWDA